MGLHRPKVSAQSVIKMHWKRSRLYQVEEGLVHPQFPAARALLPPQMWLTFSLLVLIQPHQQCQSFPSHFPPSLVQMLRYVASSWGVRICIINSLLFCSDKTWCKNFNSQLKCMQNERTMLARCHGDDYNERCACYFCFIWSITFWCGVPHIMHCDVSLSCHKVTCREFIFHSNLYYLVKYWCNISLLAFTAYNEYYTKIHILESNGFWKKQYFQAKFKSTAEILPATGSEWKFKSLCI